MKEGGARPTDTTHAIHACDAREGRNAKGIAIIMVVAFYLSIGKLSVALSLI